MTKIPNKLMKFFFVIVSFLILNSQFSILNSVRADFYSDYQYQYTKYRESVQSYQSAKATYQTYKTLTTKNEATEKLRQTIISRNEVVKTFLALVSSKMAVNPGMAILTFDQQKSWIESHQQRTLAAATLDDLNDISTEFDSQYEIIINLAKQGIGDISIYKADQIAEKTDDFLQRTETQIGRLETVGEDSSLLRRNWQTAKAKAELYQSKRQFAKAALYPKDSYNKTVGLSSSQSYLNDGLTYLKEVSGYLLEIVKYVTN